MTTPVDPRTTLGAALDRYTAMHDAAKAHGEQLQAERDSDVNSPPQSAQ